MSIKKQIKFHDLTIENVRNYERQWPEVRLKICELIRHLIDGQKIPILRIAMALRVDRGKVYRMYHGYDVDNLPQRWTEKEDKIVRKQYKKTTYKELAETLGRTKDAVCHRVKALGLRKKQSIKIN